MDADLSKPMVALVGDLIDLSQIDSGCDSSFAVVVKVAKSKSAGLADYLTVRMLKSSGKFDEMLVEKTGEDYLGRLISRAQ
jgi:hypothetical protein